MMLWERVPRGWAVQGEGGGGASESHQLDNVRHTPGHTLTFHKDPHHEGPDTAGHQFLFDFIYIYAKVIENKLLESEFLYLKFSIKARSHQRLL